MSSISSGCIGTSTHVRGFEYGYNPRTDTFTCGGVPVQDDFMLRYRLMPYLQMYRQGWPSPRRSSVTEGPNHASS